MKKLCKRLLAIVLSGMIMLSGSALTVNAAAAETDLYQPSSSSEYLSRSIAENEEYYYQRTFGSLNNYYHYYSPNIPIQYDAFEYAVIPEDIELGDEDNSIIIPAGTVAITHVDNRYRGLAIPSEINGRKVTVIDSHACSGLTNLANVSLPNTIIAIGAEAFYNTWSLTAISIPSSVKFIGDRAFYGCSYLHEIGLPDSVSVIGSDVFEGIDVTITTFRKSAADVYGKANNISLKYIDDSDFECRENYSYEDGYMHYNNTVSVVAYNGESHTLIIPKTINGKPVTSIGVSDESYSSSGMYMIRTLVIPESVTEINNIRLSGDVCAVSLPESLVSINSSAFAGTRLSAVNLPSALTHIADEAFAYTQLEEVVVPDSVISIGSEAFYNCPDLVQVYLPEGVTVGENAFNNCSHLETAVINKSVVFAENSFSARQIVGCSGSTAEEYANQRNLPFYDLNELLFEYSNRGDSVAITKYNGLDEVVAIPEAINGLPVTAIESGIFNDGGYYSRAPGFRVTSVTIPNTVQTISNNAFYKNYRLTVFAHGNAPFISSSDVVRNNDFIDLDNIEYRTEQNTAIITKFNETDTSSSGSSYYYNYNLFVSLPKVIDGKKLVAIDESAFANGNKISDIIIPNTVNAIGKDAFMNCSSLYDVYLPNSVSVIGEGAFGDCRSLLLVTPVYNEITEMWEDHYNDAKYRIVIPSSVSTLCPGAFTNCSRITSAVIPSSLIQLSDYVFSNCYYLRNVNIPDSIYYIGYYAFNNCDSLSSVTIPKTVQYIGSSAFPSSSSFVIRGYTGTIAEHYALSNHYVFEALNDSEFEYEINEDNTVTIKGLVLPPRYSSSLEIPETINGKTVTKIGSMAFADNKDIVSVTIPSTVTVIDDGAFEGCKGLRSIVIPESVTTINNAAFKECTALTSVTLPAGLSAIEDELFFDCYRLTNINIPNGVTRIGRFAFYYCKALKDIAIPNTVTSIGDYSFSHCEALTSVAIPTFVTSIREYTFYYCSKLTSVVIPNSVKSIDNDAFMFCSSLKNITIPDSVLSIGSYAFGYCSGLTSVVIPNSVKTIGYSGFANCSGLKSVVLSNSLTKIDKYVFENCKALENVIIPNSVTTIDRKAFNYCTALANAAIPKSVTSIDSTAFDSCTNLTITGYKNSAAETFASDKNIPFVTIPEETLKNTSSVKSTSIVLGDSISITGAASGGTAPYTYSYYFKKSSQSVWTAKTENTASTSVSIKPGSAVEYSIKVVALDKDGSTAEKIMKVNVNPALTNKSSVESQTITLGDTINVTGVASGGKSPYTYSYYFKKASQSSWTTKLANTSSTSVTIKPGSAVNYNVKVVVKDSTGKTEEKILTVKVNNAAVFENISSVASETIILGNTINVTGAARGGTAPYTYSYYFKKASQSSWTTKTADTSSTSVTIKPGAAVDYNVKVAAKDKNGAEAEKIFTVKVISSEDLVNNSSVASTTITLGDTINITGAASGGTAPYTYSYYFKKASQSTWTTKLANSSSTSAAVKPGSAVDYNIKVVVTDKNGKTAEKIFTVKVKAPLTNQSSVASSTITLGNTINITGAASGGTAPYKYSYYFKKSSQSTWTTKTANTTSASVTVKPGSAVEYKVKVTVTDNSGNTEDKIFTVTVKEK